MFYDFWILKFLSKYFENLVEKTDSNIDSNKKEYKYYNIIKLILLLISKNNILNNELDKVLGLAKNEIHLSNISLQLPQCLSKKAPKVVKIIEKNVTFTSNWTTDSWVNYTLFKHHPTFGGSLLYYYCCLSAYFQLKSIALTHCVGHRNL